MTTTSARHATMALSVSACALFGALQANAASLSISQVPLYLGGVVEPNIMFILDDSGSMYWSFMPDSIYGNRNTRRAKSSTYNQIYYNPAITYSPPLDKDGVALADASFTSAWFDGYDLDGRASDRTDLSRDFRPTWYYEGYSNEFAGSAEPAYYYVFDSSNWGCSGTNDDDCYDKVVVSSTSGPGGTDERTNFANWYSYYRSRMYAAKAGISRAFAVQGTGMRVGFGRINKGSDTIDGISTTMILRGVRDFSDVDSEGASTGYRRDFFDWLFLQQPTGGTPLRRALDAAGQYYERDDEKGPASTTPGSTGGFDLSCRQNFTILMTDGFYNGSDASTTGARANNDGTNGTVITGTGTTTGQFLAVSPFADSRNKTLADVAAYYWKRDLRVDLTNNVPVSTEDPAFWQHMVTFGVGLGVVGTITPKTAFDAIGSTTTTITWPDPTSSDPAKIDDLLHAAVNSRGDFFSAADPDEFAKALTNTLATINARTSSAASVAANSAQLSTDTLIYQAIFDSSDWSGDVRAFEIDQDPESTTYLQPKSTALWKAASKIPAASARNLYTFNPASSTATAFKWASLSSDQQSTLGTSALVDWLRGDQSNERAKGGIYRNRNTLMGDVVNSSPAYAGATDYGYGLSASLSLAERLAYRTRLGSTDFTNRQGMLLFGANNGIFHGINAKTGSEVFGFIPDSIMAYLPNLADPEYTHRYLVDGSPRVTDAIIDGQWSTVAVSSTGAGGRSYFAVNLENVLDSSSAGLSSSDILWEISNTTVEAGETPYAEMGVTIGQAAIGRTESGQWVAIVGNGYNSTSQTARLFVIDLETGERLAELDTAIGSLASPNGLATPLAVDADQNGSIDLVYAGDLHGNLWKFDFTSSTKNDWSVAFGGKPLFIAKNASGAIQPITAKPTAGFHPDGGLMVYFGSGKFFETGDSSDMSLQTLYGVRDVCGIGTSASGCSTATTSKVSRSDLTKQTITYEGTQDFDGNSWDVRLISDNASASTDMGFYLDLAYLADYQGERILTTPIIWSDRVIYVSAIPDDDVCSGGGDSWIIELNPFSGARTEFSVFDLARDGTYGDSSLYDGKVVSSRKVVGGMIGGLQQLKAGGKTVKAGSTSSTNFDTSVQQNDGEKRIAWRQLQ